MKKLNLALSIVIGGGFLFLAFRNVNLADVSSSFQKADYLLVIPTLFLIYFYCMVRAYRWGLIYLPGQVPSYNNRFSAIVIGIMVNNVLPAKLGEIARAFVIGKHEKIGISRSFGTIILERVFDFIALLFTLCAIALVSSAESGKILNSGSQSVFIITFVGFIVLLSLLFFLKMKTALFVKLSERIAGMFSKKLAAKAGKALTSFAEGLKPLDSPKNALKIFVVSVFLWSIQGVIAFMLMRAFGIEIGFLSAWFVVVIIILGCVIPPSPAGIGTTQLVAVLVLDLYKVPRVDSLSFAIMYNFLGAAFLTTLGWYYMVRESMRFSDILAKSREEK